MKDGIILLDSNKGKEIGFTSDNGFSGYLWKEGEYILISMIESKGRLLHLFNTIQRKGYGIKVPNPFPRMEEIVKLKGFKHTLEEVEEIGPVEVWVSDPVVNDKCLSGSPCIYIDSLKIGKNYDRHCNRPDDIKCIREMRKKNE